MVISLRVSVIDGRYKINNTYISIDQATPNRKQAPSLGYFFTTTSIRLGPAPFS